MLLGVAMPVFISVGQQIVPGQRRVANSITMGVSWGLSGAIVASLIKILQTADSLWMIYLVFALSALLSSALCRVLK